jgi:hypothetical protein
VATRDSQLRCAHDEVIRVWAELRSSRWRFVGGTGELASTGLALATHRMARRIVPTRRSCASHYRAGPSVMSHPIRVALRMTR